MGITGKILNWIGNFRNCRQQRVVVEGVYSSWSHVGSGVLQGSVLGPVLFLIYINDLPRCVSRRIRMYADDTKCFSRINCLENVEAFQQNINKFMSWFCDWQLCFHASKCKVMHIGRKNIERTYKLASVEGILDLSEVDNACDLGVNFQSNLPFDKYVANICAKTNGTVGIIKHTFSRIDIDMFKILSNALVRSILEYCSSVWCPYNKFSARKIEQIQHRATKVVENFKDVSYSDRLCFIGMPTLHFRSLRTDMIQVYKILNGYKNIDTECFFTIDSDSFTRGHSFKLKKIRGNMVRHI